MHRPTVVLFLLASQLAAETSSRAEIATNAGSQVLERIPIAIDGEYGEGWSQQVRLEHDRRNARFRLWVQEGWLHVGRWSADDDFSWHVVLARMDESDPPSIATVGQTGSFEVSIASGRYRVRESGQMLLVVRERKSSNGYSSNAVHFGDGLEPKGFGGSKNIGILVSSWSDGEWFYIASGQDQENHDVALRLNPASKAGSGYGVESHSSGVVRFEHGDTSVVDDGEMLVAYREPIEYYRSEQERIERLEAARARFLAGEAPPLELSSWMNSDGGLDWSDLEGKVVLLDFWSTNCGPCIAKFPDVQQLHQDFASAGLVVIGIHTQAGQDAWKAVAKKRGCTFPMAADSGKTAEMFGVGQLPTYFLFDRESRLVEGFQSRLPQRETIESLLVK